MQGPTERVNGKGRPDWLGLGRALLFFWYFSGMTQALIWLGGNAGFSGLRQSFTVSVLWLVPLLLWPRHTRLLAALLGGLLWLCSLAGLGYFLLYGQEFSQSVIFILFESNLAEGSEYLAQYSSPGLLLGLLAYSLIGWWLWRRLRPVYLPRPQAFVLALICLFGSLGYPALRQFSKHADWQVGLENFEQRIEPATPWQLLVGYRQYRVQLAAMQALLDSQQQVAPLAGLRDAHAGEPSTVVLVIGESTNRQRMGLYGYGRDTSPELEKLRGQLAIFDNVASPRPYTIEALQQVLTFADQESADAFLTTPTLISVMRQAGYKSWWISNQQTLTKRNTLLTSFSQQADEQIYLNNNREQNAKQYDGVVLEPFSQVLADPAPRKFIVVHLLGTHMSYQYRYPAEFARFNDRKGVPGHVSNAQLQVYNDYDNAVLYNDFVLAQLIRRFAGSQPNGFLLYLSDHGEEVYDQPQGGLLGRNEGAPTAAMYSVPFILWRSPSWATEDLSGFLHRPLSSSALIHSWADLAGLSFKEHRPEFSLVNPAFQPRPRLIGDPRGGQRLRDYESLLTPLQTAQGAVVEGRSGG